MFSPDFVLIFSLQRGFLREVLYTNNIKNWKYVKRPLELSGAALHEKGEVNLIPAKQVKRT